MARTRPITCAHGGLKPYAILGLQIHILSLRTSLLAPSAQSIFSSPESRNFQQNGSRDSGTKTITTTLRKRKKRPARPLKRIVKFHDTRHEGRKLLVARDARHCTKSLPLKTLRCHFSVLFFSYSLLCSPISLRNAYNYARTNDHVQFSLIRLLNFFLLICKRLYLNQIFYQGNVSLIFIQTVINSRTLKDQ